MTLFVALAAILAALSAGLIAWPLVRGRAPGAVPARGAALAAVITVLGGGAGLYVTWSNWDWRSPTASASDSPQTMVSSLARRLARNPDDLQGWLMLGRSYAVLGQYPLALRAYERADRLADGRNVEALVGLGETLAMQDENELAGRGGEFFERALAIEPMAVKALFFGAAAARRRGDLPLARARFETLIGLNPPEDVRTLFASELAAIDAELTAAGATAGPAVAGPTAEARAPGADEAPAEVRLRIALAPQVAARVTAGAPLFVFVREPGVAGPPVAVKRLAANFPQDVALGTQDAMIAGRSIEAGRTFEVVARVALGGTPTATAGDPYGQLRYDVGRDGVRELLIDRVTP
jgi:cytochrome c-type biogenesis protein CcmH